MKTYQVSITPKALGNMEDIYDYIAYVLQEPTTAMSQYNRIADGIESLRTFPERCRVVESQTDSRLPMRQLQVDNYSVIYAVEGDSVTVLRVLYNASDISARLRDTR